LSTIHLDEESSLTDADLAKVGSSSAWMMQHDHLEHIKADAEQRRGLYQLSGRGSQSDFVNLIVLVCNTAETKMIRGGYPEETNVTIRACIAEWRSSCSAVLLLQT
jgi:hypothetical protein